MFFTLKETRGLIEAWRVEPNHYHPHSALGYLPPSAFADQYSQNSLSDQEKHVKV